MSTVKTTPPTAEATASPAAADRPEIRRRRTLHPLSPWMALGAVLVIGGAIAVAAYTIADHPSAPTTGAQASGSLPGRIGPGGALYDSQVPAAARRGPECAVVGYGVGGSVIDSQVPAQGRAGAACVVIGSGPRGSLYDSQVPVEARDHLAVCVHLGLEPGASVFYSQVPAAARPSTSCVVVASGPGGSLYDSQVPAAARAE